VEIGTLNVVIKNTITEEVENPIDSDSLEDINYECTCKDEHGNSNCGCNGGYEVTYDGVDENGETIEKTYIPTNDKTCIICDCNLPNHGETPEVSA